MELDHFYLKNYDSQNYNCAHFIADVYSHIYGKEAKRLISKFILPFESSVSKLSIRRHFKQIKTAQENCLVVFHGRRSDNHVGVFIMGKVFHINSKYGVQLQSLSTLEIGFDYVKFYEYACSDKRHLGSKRMGD